MSRRSVRKRRHRQMFEGTIVRATIGDVDVTEALRAVYRQHRKLLERRAAISLGLAFDRTYRWPDLSGRGAS